MNVAEAKSKGKVYAPKFTSSRVGRNDRCYCGSGKKYKKCCLSKEQERNRIMQEVKDRTERGLPSSEEAVRLLRGYTNQRIIQHNATVQVLHNLTQCLEALPASEKRDFVKDDFERRLNELVGDGKGRDAQVTLALAELIAQFPALEVGSDETANETTSPAVEDEGQEASESEAEPDEEATVDSEVADDIDEIVEDEAETVS